jgi:hypothetical protein
MPAEVSPDLLVGIDPKKLADHDRGDDFAITKGWRESTCSESVPCL